MWNWKNVILNNVDDLCKGINAKVLLQYLNISAEYYIPWLSYNILPATRVKQNVNLWHRHEYSSWSCWWIALTGPFLTKVTQLIFRHLRKALTVETCVPKKRILGTYKICSLRTPYPTKCKNLTFQLFSRDLKIYFCLFPRQANLTQVEFDGDATESFFRGCAANVGIDCSLFQGCQDAFGNLVCSLCCDQNNCNGQDIKAFDETVFKCFTCAADLDANGMPVDNNTCGRVDFDGTAEDINVVEYPCPSETCVVRTFKK